MYLDSSKTPVYNLQFKCKGANQFVVWIVSLCTGLKKPTTESLWVHWVGMNLVDDVELEVTWAEMEERGEKWWEQKCEKEKGSVMKWKVVGDNGNRTKCKTENCRGRLRVYLSPSQFHSCVCVCVWTFAQVNLCVLTLCYVTHVCESMRGCPQSQKTLWQSNSSTKQTHITHPPEDFARFVKAEQD